MPTSWPCADWPLPTGQLVKPNTWLNIHLASEDLVGASLQVCHTDKQEILSVKFVITSCLLSLHLYIQCSYLVPQLPSFPLFSILKPSSHLPLSPGSVFLPHKICLPAVNHNSKDAIYILPLLAHMKCNTNCIHFGSCHEYFYMFWEIKTNYGTFLAIPTFDLCTIDSTFFYTLFNIVNFGDLSHEFAFLGVRYVCIALSLWFYTEILEKS